MKLRKPLALAFSLVALWLAPGFVRSDDIDLYVSGAQQLGSAPNVLIIIDNTSNYASTSQGITNTSGAVVENGAAEWNALKTVLNGLVQSSGGVVNVGIMLGGESGSAQGGYVRFAIRAVDSTNAAAMTTMANDAIAKVQTPREKISSNGPVLDNLLNDAYRYFNGKAKFGPHDDGRDYAGNDDYLGQDGVDHPAKSIAGNAFSDAGDTVYNAPPAADDGCARNFIILIGNGFPSPAASSSTFATNANAALGTTLPAQDLAQLPMKKISGSGAGSDVTTNHWADEWARLLKKYGVPAKKSTGELIGTTNPIVTYTIDVYKDHQDHDQTALLSATATQGGGKYFAATNESEITSALATIFAEIQAVNSVFTSATLPVSVNLQGIFENQVYFGVFRPDPQSRPRWFGNLKQYRFGLRTNADGTRELFLADARDPDANTGELNAAINANTGFITDQAVSFWTASSTFWSFDPRGNTSTPSSDSPDGPLVEKGGAAQVLRSGFDNATRKVYTCLGDCLTNPASATAHLNADGNKFIATNTAVTGLLVPPGSETLSLSAAYVDAAKTAIAVTASVQDGAHSFIIGDQVNISGATPAAYSGTHTVTGIATGSFTYSVPVNPVTPATGTIQASPASGATSAITQVDVDYASNRAVFTPASMLFANGDQVAVTGVADARFNVTGSASDVTTTTFSLPVTYPQPSTPATAAGKSKAGSNVEVGNASVRRYGRTVVVQISAGPGKKLADYGLLLNASVTVSGTTPSDYSGSFTIAATGTACNGTAFANTGAVANADKDVSYCYYLVTGQGAGGQATKILDPKTVSLTRNGTTVTAKTSGSAHGFSGTVTISGANQTEYNGDFTIVQGTESDGADTTAFHYSLAALSPSTTISGSITAVPASQGKTETAADLVNWTRGVDVWEDENVNASKTDVRASVHADVLHSRPVAVNYGGSTGVVVFYGSNDGFLHAVSGAQTGTGAGAEHWAFIPQEFISYTKLTRLFQNTPLVKYPTTPANIVPAPKKRDYFWDGPIGILRSTSGATTLAYIGFRRGGRFMYALNISDISDPKVLWRISSSDTGFGELGQTWSLPQAMKFKATRSSDGEVFARTAVAFGAGYDNAENDKTPGTTRAPTMGRGVFVVDAVTGAKIALMQPPPSSGTVTPGSPSSGIYDFAADIVPVDIDADGYVDRIYAADTASNVWRFDVDQVIDATDTWTSPGASWTAYKIASLGDVGLNGGSDDRKVLFAPNVLTFRDTQLNRIVAQVMVATGDRESPLDSTISNRFYSVLDTIEPGATTTTGYPLVESDLQQITFSGGVGTQFNSATYKGWYITLDAQTGEKAVNAPTLAGGVIFFATNAPTTINPDAGICSNLGNARGYAVSPFSGLPAVDRDADGDQEKSDYYGLFTGGGLPPTITSGVVRMTENGQDVYVPFVIGSGISRVESSSEGGGTSSVSQSGSDQTSVIGASLNVDVSATRRARGFWHFQADE